MLVFSRAGCPLRLDSDTVIAIVFKHSVDQQTASYGERALDYLCSALELQLCESRASQKRCPVAGLHICEHLSRCTSRRASDLIIVCTARCSTCQETGAEHDLCTVALWLPEVGEHDVWAAELSMRIRRACAHANVYSNGVRTDFF